MGQCVLPVSKPYITHTPVIANMLSILQTNPNTESWIANHFVNIFINKDRIFDNFYDKIYLRDILLNSLLTHIRAGQRPKGGKFA